MVDALNGWAQQTGLQLIVPDADATNGLEAPRLKGTFTAQAALSHLLAGTQLTYEFVNERTVAIHARTPASTPAADKQVDGRFLRLAAAQIDEMPRSSDGGAAEAEAQQILAANARESGSNNIRLRGSLEEIIVTAQKRTERLQDVPVPVTAISADKLIDTNQRRLQDYYTRMPGLSVTYDGIRSGLPAVAIRGITTSPLDNPTVGIVVDELPYGSATSIRGGSWVLTSTPAI